MDPEMREQDPLASYMFLISAPVEQHFSGYKYDNPDRVTNVIRDYCKSVLDRESVDYDRIEKRIAKKLIVPENIALRELGECTPFAEEGERKLLRAVLRVPGVVKKVC